MRATEPLSRDSGPGLSRAVDAQKTRKSTGFSTHLRSRRRGAWDVHWPVCVCIPKLMNSSFVNVTTSSPQDSARRVERAKHVTAICSARSHNTALRDVHLDAQISASTSARIVRTGLSKNPPRVVERRRTLLRYPSDHLRFRSQTADSVVRAPDARGEGLASQQTSRRSSGQKGICIVRTSGVRAS
jgi:hypothetical protein